MIPHIPVLLNEVLKTFDNVNGKFIIDGTFGAGGYSKKLLEKGAEVLAFDKDSSVIPFAEELKQKYNSKFNFINDSFSNIQKYITKKPYGMVFDLGVSSMQLDDKERGFSFRFDSDLDMRMNSDKGKTAKELLKELSIKELSYILKIYGEVKKYYIIAKSIKENNPQTTYELKSLIYNPKDINKVFQALRIAVNNELDDIKTMLSFSKDILQEKGILICVSFHSLEDRLIKRAFKEWTTVKGLDFIPNSEKPLFKLLDDFKPSKTEMLNNNRSRSAHLRAIQKL